MWQPRDFLADATFPSIGGYVTGTLLLAGCQVIMSTENAPLARLQVGNQVFASNDNYYYTNDIDCSENNDTLLPRTVNIR